MSLLLNKSNTSKIGTPSFHEFKKQASFFLKEKFKTARLALTDVTPAELMTEEATNGNPWAPDIPTLRSISRAAFLLDDYWRIVEILHKRCFWLSYYACSFVDRIIANLPSWKGLCCCYDCLMLANATFYANHLTIDEWMGYYVRLLKFDKKNWRVSYNSLIVLEHLLTHGPESVADEFQSDKDAINQMKCFQYIDDRGFNWGLTVRKKSERILKMLQEGTLLKEERNRARKLSKEIQGFGSFNQRSNPSQGIILLEKPLQTTFGRCNSDFNNHENQENQSSCSNICLDTAAVRSPSSTHHGGFVVPQEGVETLSYLDDEDENQMLQKSETSSKENMTHSKEEFHRWNMKGESNPLLEGSQEDGRHGIFTAEDNHPFNSAEMHSTSSLLSS